MIDEKTGLPELPDYLFWRVTRDFRYTYETYCLELRMKRWFGSSRISRTETIHPSKVNADTLRDYATAILKNLDTSRAAESFAGDYPPKRLA